MSRVAILTDRLLDDRQWKGPLIWTWISGLLESQHEILVISTRDLRDVPLSHPRLQTVQPVTSWHIKNIGKLARVLLGFKPQCVHSIGIALDPKWPLMQVWPVLNSMFSLFPDAKRFSTFFDQKDFNEQKSALTWHLGSKEWSTFTSLNPVNSFKGRIELCPLEVETLSPAQSSPATGQSEIILIPAPVSEWLRPEENLQQLLTLLLNQPKAHAEIVGGWGTWPTAKRQKAWKTLLPVAHRIFLREPMQMTELVEKIKLAKTVWIDPVEKNSWLAVLSASIARTWGKTLLGPELELISGSTVNFLSRLYST